MHQRFLDQVPTVQGRHGSFALASQALRTTEETMAKLALLALKGGLGRRASSRSAFSDSSRL